MHIKQLELNCFRGAGALTVDLHPRLNVFVGKNGAGKSTLLDAAAILLSWLPNRIRTLTSSGRPLNDPNDIRNDSHKARIGLTLGYNQQTYKWHLTKYRAGYTREEESKSNLTALNQLVRQFQEKITASKSRTNLPLCVYYPVNRAVLDIPLRIRDKHPFDLLSAFDDALTSAANFRTFFEWFRNQEDLENENRRYENDLVKPEGYNFPDRQLEAVRKAVSKALPGFTNLTVRRQPLRMEVTKDNHVVTVNQLSDGEKCLMAMVSDLARRLSISNPERDNPLEGEAIVLIDEIDLHLHPAWQHQILHCLMDLFPNAQFIISTHSPHVITHVPKDSLFLLEMRDANLEICPASAYGKAADQVLKSVMGMETTRPDDIEQVLRAIYRDIEAKDYDVAKQKLRNLQNEIDEDPDITRAEVLIARLQILGK